MTTCFSGSVGCVFPRVIAVETVCQELRTVVCVCVCVCMSLAGSNDANRAGAEKYTGGRGGSARNFPGVDGSAPLVIPHSAFTVRFVSDGR